jgi:hypothetical protein
MLVQGDSPEPNRGIYGIAVIFAAALALLAIPAISLHRTRKMARFLLLFIVGMQAASVCTLSSPSSCFNRALLPARKHQRRRQIPDHVSDAYISEEPS